MLVCDEFEMKLPYRKLMVHEINVSKKTNISFGIKEKVDMKIV